MAKYIQTSNKVSNHLEHCTLENLKVGTVVDWQRMQAGKSWGYLVEIHQHKGQSVHCILDFLKLPWQLQGKPHIECVTVVTF